MIEIKNLKDLLRNTITENCSFREYGKDVLVNRVSEIQNLRIEKNEDQKDDFHFQATANLTIPKGVGFSTETYYLDGYFDVDDNENVAIKGKISITKR